MQKIIQFGIPVIVAVFLSVYFFETGFKKDSNYILIPIFAGLAFIGFLIVGIIVRFITKDNFVIYSSLLSLAAMIVVYFVFNTISNMKKANERFYNSPEQVEIRLQNDLKRIEELTSQINQNPNDYKLIGERGIACYNTKQYEKAIPDLTSAIENDQANIEVYRSIIESYENIEEYEKEIEYRNLVIKKNEEGKIELSDDEWWEFHVSYDLEDKLKEQKQK